MPARQQPLFIGRLNHEYHVTIPGTNDIMQNIDALTIIMFIPICDRFLYPGLRKIGIQFKPITRITWGLILAALAMYYATYVQRTIYNAGP